MKKILGLALLVSLFVGFTSCSKSTSKTLELGFEVGLADADCPMDLGDGLIMTGVDFDGDYVLYTYTYDEEYNEVTVDAFEDPFVNEMMKEAAIEALRTDEDSKEMVKLCKDAEHGIIYRYKGNVTGYEADVKIECNEL